MAPALIDDSYGDYTQPEPAVSTGKPASYNTPGSTVASSIGHYTPSPSRFLAECHPLEEQITAEVDGYFLQHWPFKTDKDRKKFVAAGFSRVTCLYFPKALDDRIGYASMLLTLLFLIDDLLEDISLEEGSAYNEKLIPIARGDVLPDRAVPVEWIMYDLWEGMRAHDKVLADGILEPTFTFMRAQTDKARLSTFGLKDYLVYRERDVGKALLVSLMRFSMKLHVTPDELASVQPIEQNCAKHISVLNDILSWDKEYLASQIGHPEGSAICSAVQVLSDETSLSYDASKRVLWTMCREWELQHELLVQQRHNDSKLGISDSLTRYIKGLEYQLSGNELWSLTTFRYNDHGMANA